VREIILQWVQQRHLSTVSFKEETSPANDPHDDYIVAYEASFEPKSLDQARVEVWVTTQGNVAIGFETRKRISTRLGLTTKSTRFGAGHEPALRSGTGLLAILGAVADGKIAIRAIAIPFFGLISTKAVTLHDVRQELVSKGYTPVDWLMGVSENEFAQQKLLRFRRWDD